MIRRPPKTERFRPLPTCPAPVIRRVPFHVVVFAALCHGLVAQTFNFPADSGVINVRTDLVALGAHTSNAVGDGVADDTAALQAAIRFALNRPARQCTPFVYLPNGTYRVSNTLFSRVGSTWRDGMIVTGQSRAGVVIQLVNNATGFNDPANPKGVFMTGSDGDTGAKGEGDKAFRHHISNLTIRTGTGNAGAAGIDFLANNRGSIENVTIQSGAGSGYCGILMIRSNPGPLLIKNVEIEGFTRGIRIGWYDFGVTLENITLKNQTVYGIYNTNNLMAIRNLTSINTVPVIWIEEPQGMITLVGGNFTGGSGGTAIRNDGKLYVRDLSCAGYGTVIDNTTGTLQDIAGGAGTTSVPSYSSHTINKLWTENPNEPLRLPIEETPAFHANDFTRWVNVIAMGATTNNGTNDDSIGIQAAIDTPGVETVYLPAGLYDVDRTIVIRGSVRRIVGLAARIDRKGSSGGPMFRFDGGTADTVILEYLSFESSIEHNSAKTLVLRHSDMLQTGYYNTANGTGKLFLEDCIGRINSAFPQSIWARQLNSESGSFTQITNSGGGEIWLLGLKTEHPNTVVNVSNGGAVELYGGFFFPTQSVPASTTPIFRVNEASGSFTYATGRNDYPLHVQETRGGITRNLTESSVPSRGTTSAVPLVVAYPSLTPKGYWALDNTGADGSGNGNTFSLTNGAVFSTASRVGSHSADFDGVNDYASAGNGAALNPTAAVTVAGWVSHDGSAPNTPKILCKWNSYFIGIDRGQSNRVYGGIYGAGSFTTTPRGSTVPSLPTDGTWRHLAMTWSPAGGIKMYYDGQLVSTAAKSSMSPSTEPFTLGNQRPGDLTQGFNGRVDEVYLFDEELTAAEILDLYNDGAGSTSPVEVVKDNTDASGVTVTGTWVTTTTTPGYHGANYLHDDNTGKGTKSVRYTPDLPQAGTYQVFIRYTSGSNRSAAVPVTITHSGGTASVNVNQQSGGGTWVSLGNYSFAAGTAGNVLVSNTGTTGFVIADAIRFVKP